MTITASAVSRHLRTQDWARSFTGQGGHRKAGYRCEDSYDFNHRPAVRVSWIPGDDYRTHDSKDVSAIVLANVKAMQQALSARYVVRLEKPDQTFGGDPYLMITKKHPLQEDDE